MSFKRMIVSQGSYSQIAAFYGSEDIAAAKYADCDVICLSHAGTWNVNGCLDTADPILPSLLTKIRAINPNIEIFGYVSGTADAPTGCGYGPGNEYAQTGWMPAGGICTQFINWTSLWDTFNVNGIIIDLVAPQYMSAAVRNNVYSWCRYKNYKIMANSTYPSTANCAFAADGLGAGDYLLIEGFCYGLGNSTLAGTNSALVEVNSRRSQGFSMAALCSMPWSTAAGQTVSPSDVENLNAVSLMTNFGVHGDAYQYDRADLGIVCKTIPLPAI